MLTPVPTAENLRVYELAILYSYPILPKEEATLFGELTKLFEEHGGKVLMEDRWGRRGLAYPVRGAKEGSFVIYYLELPPEKIKELDQSLRILKGVLRHLMVRPPKHYEVVKYSEKYLEWQKEREEKKELVAREAEEELQKRMVEKAKREVRRAERKIAEEAKVAEGTKEEKVTKEKLSEEIEKLISDEDLGI